MVGKDKRQLYKQGYLGGRRKKEKKRSFCYNCNIFISLNKKGSKNGKIHYIQIVLARMLNRREHFQEYTKTYFFNTVLCTMVFSILK